MFCITDYRELSGWRPIEMTMPLVKQADCPCGGELETICALVGDRRVDVGACPECGYLGYINRPSAQWFADFYSQDWDDGENKPAIEELAAHLKEKAYRIHPAALMVTPLYLPLDAAVLEVGCGYGLALRNLRHIGYQNLTGVESSEHRAKAVREAFGLNVTHGKFSDVGGRFHLIYSHHVLEHYYDPGEFIDHAASLQSDGDYLAFSVPPQILEPTLGVLLFLPHLHSFTPLTLVKMLTQRGYSIKSLSINWRCGLEVIAQKGGQRTPHGVHGGKPADKIRHGILWDERPGECICWEADSDRTEWTAFDARLPRCASVRHCQKITDAPYEIQFDGHVRLCVK